MDLLFQLFASRIYLLDVHITPLLYGPLLLVGALIYFLPGKWHMMLKGGDDRRTMQASEKELASTKETAASV